jgi:hypothetical protein
MISMHHSLPYISLTAGALFSLLRLASSWPLLVVFARMLVSLGVYLYEGMCMS